MRLFFLVLVLFLSNSISAQFVEGYIRDLESNKPLPYASISIENSTRGSISNEEGYFRIKVNETDSFIVCSYVGYKKKRFEIHELKFTEDIFLEPSEVILNITTVHSDNSYLYDIFDKVRGKMLKSETSKSRAYMKIQSQDNEEPIELIECYYNSTSNAAGIKDLKLKNGRAGVSLDLDKKYLSLSTSKFFAYFNLSRKQDFMPGIPFQMKKNELKKKYHLSHLMNVDDSTIYIHFMPMNDKNSFFEGNVYIDLRNHSIKQLELSIDSADRFPFVPIGKSTQLDHIEIRSIINFKSYKMYRVPESIEFEYAFTMKRNPNQGNNSMNLNSTGSLSRKITARGILYQFETGKPFDLPHYEYDESYNDYVQISLLSLNSSFWQFNHGLPLTEKDQQKINYFEEKGKVFNYQSQSDKRNRGQDNVLASTASIVWRDSIRISLIESTDPEAAPYSARSSTIPSQRYNIEVQLFLDLVEDGPSYQYYSATVLDVAQTYYLFEQEPFTDIFLNMYFDLCEIERRSMVQKIENGEKSKERILRIYANSIKSMKARTDQYLMDIDRGRNIRAIADYSKLINSELGIDNVKMLGVGLD